MADRAQRLGNESLDDVREKSKLEGELKGRRDARATDDVDVLIDRSETSAARSRT